MIVIENIEHLNKVIQYHNHESKKIGKLDINYNKALTDKFYLHQGHKDCIKKLKDNGCSYILIECINSKSCFKASNENHENNESTMTGYLDYDKKVIDNTQLIKYCENLDIDYLIIDSDDYDVEIPKNIVNFVDKIIEEENYIDDLKLTKRNAQMLRVNLIVRSFRFKSVESGIVYIKSYKDGDWTFALKHYIEKYLNSKLILIEPTLQNMFYYPLSSTDKLKYYKNVKLFFNFFYFLDTSINFDSYIEKIKICGKNLDLNLEIKIIENKKYLDGKFININFLYKNNHYSVNKIIEG